jgi:hypothetical protein
MILYEWDAPKGNPGQYCVHLYAFYNSILSTSFTTVSVSIFSVCCYSSVSISVVQGMNLFCVVQTAVIVSLDSRMTGLSRALRVFEDTDLHLVHIESRRHKVSKVIVNMTLLNLAEL